MKTETKNKIKDNQLKLLETLKTYFDAHQFVIENKFYKYLFISGFVFLLLFSIVLKLLLLGIDYVKLPTENLLLPILLKFLKFSQEEIKNGLEVSFWLIKKTIESNKDAIFSFAFMILGTPYLSYISNSVAEMLTQQKTPFNFKTFLKDISRGIRISIRTSFKQFLLILAITLISFVPVVEIIAPLLVFVVQAYYNGILLTDYSLEREGYTIKESNTFYKNQKPQMFAIGLGFMFLLMIPVIGWFLAPTYGIVASSLVIVNKK